MNVSNFSRHTCRQWQRKQLPWGVFHMLILECTFKIHRGVKKQNPTFPFSLAWGSLVPRLVVRHGCMSPPTCRSNDHAHCTGKWAETYICCLKPHLITSPDAFPIFSCTLKNIGRPLYEDSMGCSQVTSYNPQGLREVL